MLRWLMTSEIFEGSEENQRFDKTTDSSDVTIVNSQITFPQGELNHSTQDIFEVCAYGYQKPRTSSSRQEYM